jgi:plasmid replication initiation protein
MSNSLPEKIARIDNGLIMNAQYKLTAKEQKVLYYLISFLKPKDEQAFNKIIVPIREIEDALKEPGRKWGGLYAEMERLCESMISRKISFPSKFLVDGKRIRGHINWFQSIMPIENDYGQVCIEFLFSEPMKPFLLQLNEYVRISTLEVAQMKSGHSIRMFSIFKSEKDRLRGVKSVVRLAYEFDELKALLGIEDKYNSGDLKDFRNRVLNVIRNEINLMSQTMSVDYEYRKTGRKVTGVEFVIMDKGATAQTADASESKKPSAKTSKVVGSESSRANNDKMGTPTTAKNPQKGGGAVGQNTADVALLTRARLQAYYLLTDFGVFEGIALKQILPSLKSTETDGFEDVFIEKACAFFLKNTKVAESTKAIKAATFVTWWLENKVFEQGNVWSKLIEQVVTMKKELSSKNSEAFQNRLTARMMPNADFEAFYKKGKD